MSIAFDAMDFGTEQKPLCGICGCDCPEQACNWSENETLNNDVICVKCDEKYEYDDESDSYELKQEVKKTLKIVGFAERDHYQSLAGRFYKDGRVADTYITGQDIWEHFQDYYDTEELCRVIDAGLDESWLLCRHEATDELKDDTRGWMGEIIWSIEGLNGVFHTKYNTSSSFAMWLCYMEWCECEEWCDE